nr:MAG TPA: YIEGIA protein [Caudoviricetes sp.]
MLIILTFNIFNCSLDLGQKQAILHQVLENI